MIDNIKVFMNIYHIDIMNPLLLCGMFIGAMMAFIFCALTMKAVGRAAGSMVEEVRRQFKEKPGIMAGTDQARIMPAALRSPQKALSVK